MFRFYLVPRVNTPSRCRNTFFFRLRHVSPVKIPSQWMPTPEYVFYVGTRFFRLRHVSPVRIPSQCVPTPEYVFYVFATFPPSEFRPNVVRVTAFPRLQHVTTPEHVFSVFAMFPPSKPRHGVSIPAFRPLFCHRPSVPGTAFLRKTFRYAPSDFFVTIFVPRPSPSATPPTPASPVSRISAAK